ncbi:putative transcription factor [Aspergillus ibericus CBS 121593]|uniref:Putative fungal-specific transcription factor n=1 Tax=Aspergillus ibericus CBS 121593 TaxID=1448316 RepID=A0A395H4A7_9EURO|nr:putative fungal-specific transcription factor [Aspergillus ibericus CBS 121593]RAL02586.1 putative fungal-specific transcription factor [Aspergillus ibericus CBS 121593]
MAAGQQTPRNLAVKQTPPIRAHTPIPVSPPVSRAQSIEPQSISASSTSTELLNGTQDSDPEQDSTYYTAHGRFAGDVAAAIDAKNGLSLTATSNRVPFVDAPLFGDVDLDSLSHLGAVVELPPRPSADNLVNIYFQHIDPAEPVLDPEHFHRHYEQFYSDCGSFRHADQDYWPSILNTVFALAVQRQELIPQQARDEKANGYFRLAWALLRPETILWTSGSIELVQCLMLMNRYLHCTNNQQKTWMTAGLAMRIAQNMCAQPSPVKERELKERVWASCIALDRCVSWSLGRTSAPSLTPLPSRPASVSLSGGHKSGRHAERLRRALELHEIGSHIQLAQTQTRNSLAAGLGLPRLYQQDEYHAVAVQLDTSLNKWEESLPSDWQLRNIPNVVDRVSRAEGYLLHLRLLHTRICLHRPMLARYSLKSKTPPPAHTSNPPSLSDRLLRESATICIEAAQTITSLILEVHNPEEPIGLLPWWYRIYYLHIAGTIFLAAMFSSELFTISVSQSWKQVMSSLRAHEHLSTYIPQCIRTFETFSRYTQYY